MMRANTRRRERTRLFVGLGLMAALVLIAGMASVMISAGDGDDSGDEVRILARKGDDGRTEVALQQRHADHSWSEPLLAEYRFLPSDVETGEWHVSSGIHLQRSEEAVSQQDEPYMVAAAAVGATATVSLSSPEGDAMGEVTLTQGPRGVLIQARVSGLEPGPHGFHIHEVGSCEPDFTAAGGHYNPGDTGHGVLDEGGHHAGDLPNLIAHDDGAGLADYYTADVTLATGVKHSLFDADGSAIVVHANPDSYGADPMAGGRVACGVIELN